MVIRNYIGRYSASEDGFILALTLGMARLVFLNFHKNFFCFPDPLIKCLNFLLKQLPGLPLHQTSPFIKNASPFIKNAPILITLLISFSFNHAIIFCIYTCV